MEAAVIAAVVMVMILLQPAEDKVVLLPGADGQQTGMVVVKTATGEKVLDRPYAAADVSRQGTIKAHQESAESVRQRFGETLAAQPQRPVSYIVYFRTSSDELTPESLAVVEKLKADLQVRKAPEIVAIGHTDRVGSVGENDVLSLKRAETMRGILVAAGIAAASVEVAGRGEREPQVVTADEVAEARNRRVEINVR
ncbi:MAG: OmpA/MotB [Proteobacteria bacterium]|nr:OmpA/MotB [Pseudomonadota bacterium]